MREPVVRVAGPGDAAALAWLRGGDEPGFAPLMGAWLAAEGERRTTWLATVGDAPVGMVSMLEYRRMPRPDRLDSRWGYVGNLFVLDAYRDRGIGGALLAAVVGAADARGYVRLVLSPSERSVALYERAGFVVPDSSAGGDRLLVRPRPA
jgi:GNAT superfamily N-acetyltransferase